MFALLFTKLVKSETGFNHFRIPRCGVGRAHEEPPQSCLRFCKAFPDQFPVEINESEADNAAFAKIFEFETRSDEVESPGKVSYAGNQLWKVSVETDKKKRIISLLRDHKDISTWGGNLTSLDILVKPKHLQTVANQLKENGIDYQILIEDLQKAIDEENPPFSENLDDLQDRTGHRMTWQAYHRLNDIYSYLDFLGTSYPRLCTVTTIGHSVEGKPIKLLKISNKNPGNKAVWIDGGIHAREWISPATVTSIINYLVENYGSESKSVQNIDWHILPVVNPDGYEYSHTTDRLWRKNRAKKGVCAGTDLNRNFGYQWGGKGSGKYPCQEIYGGTGPFSEPETAAIKNYITGTERSADWQGYVSFHSYGQYILHPWGYDKVVPPDHEDLKNVGNKMAAAMKTAGGATYRVGSSAILLYPAAGGSDDWAKGMGMKYAYTIELRDTGNHGFVLPASHINPSGKEGVAAIKVLASVISAA